MNPQGSQKKQAVSFFLLILITSLILTPFTAFGIGSVSASDSDPFALSKPVAAKIGLDGPKPPDIQYSSKQAIGTYNLIVILVQFTDETSLFSPTEIRTNVLTELDTYYDEISYGLIQVDGDTTPTWYDLGHDRAYYVEGTSFPSDPKFNLVEDAIELADDDVNFALYDGVTIIHAGQGQELSHDWKDYWSSEWWNFNIATDDGITLHRASVSPEESTSGNPSYVGVLAHEFGHDLGLPDLYDVTYSGHEYVGHWGLMGKGSWNGPLGVGDQPSHMMGWSKAELGWINGSQIVEAISELAAVIDPLELSTLGVHLVKIPVTGQQYFLIEVRRKIGSDASLPGTGAGSEGVLITYIDESLQSGYGIVKVIDSHPLTSTKDDGAFGLGLGEVDSYVSSAGQFSMVVEEEIGQSYNVSIIRAYMEFITPLDGSAILSPDLLVEWSGSAAAPGIDHYELYIDGTLSYNGTGTSHPVSGLAAGLHNATLIMELAGTGRRLSIQSLFVVDLAAPVISLVRHFPEMPAFGDSIIISLEATDDTWIVNASVYYQRQGDTRWYQIEMYVVAGSEWQGILGTFLPGVSVNYYVAVTDAGGRTVTDDNSGSYYNFVVQGIGLIIWLILAAFIVLIFVLFVCMRWQRRRRRESQLAAFPTQDSQSMTPGPGTYSPPPLDLKPPSPGQTGFCYHCGAPLTPNATFCGYCGRAVT